MQFSYVAEGGRVELHRERLIEDRQEIRIVVGAVFECSARFEHLNEECFAGPLAVGSFTRIARARFEAYLAAVPRNG